MESNNIFSFTRLAYLIKRYYVLTFKQLLIEVLSAIGLLAILGGLTLRHSHEHGYQIIAWFYFIMILGGLIKASTSFNELHKPEKSIQFLTLPASSFEKLFAAWINTTIIFILISLIGYHIAILLANILSLWWFKTSPEWVSLFNFGFWKAIVLYFITHTIFLFGSVYFKGKNFFKTVFSLFAIFLFFSIYHSLVGKAAMNEIATIFFEVNSLDPTEVISAPGLEVYFHTTLQPILKTVFYYIMPAFFLVLSYIKLKEREV